MIVYFHSCGAFSVSQTREINWWNSFCKAGPPSFMSSGETLSRPAARLFFRRPMAEMQSANVGTDSSSGVLLGSQPGGGEMSAVHSEAGSIEWNKLKKNFFHRSSFYNRVVSKRPFFVLNLTNEGRCLRAVKFVNLA